MDEADRLLDDLDYNFGEQLSTIFAALPTNRQTLLFSATLTEKLQEVSELALKKPFFWASKDSYVFSFIYVRVYWSWRANVVGDSVTWGSYFAVEERYFLPSSRQHLSLGDCLEDKRENYQKYSVLCCVQQLYTICTRMWAVITDQCCFRFSFCAFV